MTDKLREAAQQALEAFEEIAWSNDSKWQADRAKVVSTTLRAALAEQQAEQDQGHAAYNGWVLREVLFDNGEPIGHRAQEPLTDEEALNLWSPEPPRPVLGKNKVLAFARAIERAHGIGETT